MILRNNNFVILAGFFLLLNLLFNPIISLASAATSTLSYYVAIDARSMLPKTLQQMIYLYWNEVVSSIKLSAIEKEKRSEDYYWHGNSKKISGKAPMVISRNAYNATVMLQKQKSMKEIFSEFGKVAFSVTESFNPLNTADSDKKEIYYYTSFEKFMEHNLSKFRILFTGYTLIPMKKNIVRKELENRLLKINRFYKPLSNAYRQRLDKGESFEFGFQSIPFGIAMITYSKTVNAVVDIWCSIWKAGGGELNNPPFDISS